MQQGPTFSFCLQQGHVPNGLKIYHWDPSLKGSTVTQAEDQATNPRALEGHCGYKLQQSCCERKQGPCLGGAL